MRHCLILLTALLLTPSLWPPFAHAEQKKKQAAHWEEQSYWEGLSRLLPRGQICSAKQLVLRKAVKAHAMYTAGQPPKRLAACNWIGWVRDPWAGVAVKYPKNAVVVRVIPISWVIKYFKDSVMFYSREARIEMMTDPANYVVVALGTASRRRATHPDGFGWLPFPNKKKNSQNCQYVQQWIYLVKKHGFWSLPGPGRIIKGMPVSMTNKLLKQQKEQCL